MIEALTGISTIKFRESIKTRAILPHNSLNTPLELDYQRQLARRNLFWYAVPVIEGLSQGHPQLASQVGYPETNSLRYTRLSAILFAINNSIAAAMHQVTGLWIPVDLLHELAHTSNSLATRKAHDKFLIDSSRLSGDSTDDWIDYNATYPSSDLESTREQLIYRVGSQDLLNSIFEQHIFDKPQGILVGWTSRSLNLPGIKIIPGVEDPNSELIILGTSPIPLSLVQIEGI